MLRSRVANGNVPLEIGDADVAAASPHGDSDANSPASGTIEASRSMLDPPPPTQSRRPSNSRPSYEAVPRTSRQPPTSPRSASAASRGGGKSIRRSSPSRKREEEEHGDSFEFADRRD